VAKPVRKKQSNKRFVGVLIAIGVAGIAILGYSVSRPRAGIKPVDPNMAPGTAEGYLIGSPDAPVKVLEFADFECPVCAQWAQVTKPDIDQRLIASGVMSLRLFDFPLDMHPNSWPASNAVACAADQGKFKEMHDQVFALQEQWAFANGNRDPRSGLSKAAQQSGVDMSAWNTCFDSQKHYPRIKANLQEGIRYGVGSTPTFVIAGKVIPGRLTYDEFKKYVDEALAADSAARKQGAKASPAKSGR
jgi:protein-disulfide isomerase